MLEAALTALGIFTDPGRLALLFAGVAAGLIVGVLPGMGGIVAVSLILPYIYKLDAMAAAAVLTGALAVVHTSDTITSVLIGAPGSAAAATSVIEGHALAKQGQAARALAAAFLSSLVGGLIGALGLTLAIPIARPLVLALGSPELFMLTALGVSYAGSLLGKEARKGLLAGLLGILLGMVGPSPAAAQVRFDFGRLYLMDGIPLVVVALGIFGIAEVIALLARGGAIASATGVGVGWLQGIRDVLQHRWLVLRGALIGVWAGILPALGATAGTWMAYGHVVAASRDRSRFGKGDIRGIIAPEAANNAVAAGDLIPTLLFWVPGSASAALLVGALLRYGILPGPRIVTEHLPLIYVIIWSYAIANVLGAGTCFAVSPALARITYVPFVRLAAPVLIAIALGAYQTTQDMGDLVALFLLGLLGWMMSKSGWPRAPLLIGFVLAGPMERYFVITTNLYGFAWLARPGVVIIGAILVAPFVWGLWSSIRRRRAAEPAAQAPPRRMPLDLALSLAVLAIFAGALGMIRGFVPGARLMPLVAATPGLVLAAVQVVRVLQGRSTMGDEEPPSQADRRAGLFGFAVLAGFFTLLWLAGFHPAAAAFMLVFLLGPARMRPGPALLFTAATIATITGLGALLGVHWPPGLVGRWL
ncbi:MAG: tripartite tricarboxylate transporter permease [Armatimonadota bacterium]|nr:tripartite tricarboxylate transporter permease [Armatimonadota bacterium]MDR7520584.1 tripartite tricarboxylate transporter permease [Armatimonadota bacterium]